MQYRPEIDGLRAIAVLPVILFHAGLTGFAGGYVGVDIFFVISGYLITGILWSELEKGNFSFRHFYERRIRRILPALIFVMACTLPFGWLWLPPDRFEELGASALAALYSVSNFYFYREAGYFARASETQPLLHTWSLGVEEQFYMLFPIALLLLHRRVDRQRTMLWLACVAILSLLFCEWAWKSIPDANFFLIPSRAWELMAGALCALYMFRNERRGSAWLAAIGLALIILSVAFFDKRTPFPSMATLLPVGGTVLIILFARHGNWMARLLSMRALVGLGLISYSAYLWHQPLFAFARLRMIDHPPTWLMLALSVLSLVLAVISWKFVEQPFRRRATSEGLRSRLSSVRIVGISCIVLALLTATILATSGVPQRFDTEILAKLQETSARPADMNRCKTGYTDPEPKHCEHGERDNPTLRIALIGDSHASQWTAALGAVGERRRWLVDTYAKSACPLADVKMSLLALQREYRECTEWRHSLFAQLAKQQYDLVIASQSAMGYVSYEGKYSVPQDLWTQGMARFGAQLDRLPGKWLILSDNPQFRDPLAPDCIAKTEILNFAPTTNCDHARADALDGANRKIERALAASSDKGHWHDPAPSMCDTVRCRPQIGKRMLLSDSHHLSVAGVDLLSSGLEKAIIRVAGPKS